MFASANAADVNGKKNQDWVSKPLTLADALNLSLRQNRTILKSASDLEAAHGISLQVRAVAIPKVQLTGNYTATDKNALESVFPGQSQARQSWEASSAS